MAGIGVRLNKIYEKNTLTTHLAGFFYSTAITIAPMIMVILSVFIMERNLGYSTIGYSDRELFSSTLLYVFIFSLLTAAPFNSVLSRYMSDVIYEENFDDIRPCYDLGMTLNIFVSGVLGFLFCAKEYLVGGVDIFYVFVSYCGYMSLVLVFYSMLYLLICKDYRQVSTFFAIGMIVAVALAFIFVKKLGMEVTVSMLLGLDVGYIIIAALEYGLIRSYFRENSKRYVKVLEYFKKYWQLSLTNFLYILGLYIHNFVFWSTSKHIVVANCFVSLTSYDMASCIAMFTNISATVIFTTRVEMHFHPRYKAYSEAVIGGRGMDIEIAKKRMFRKLGEEISNLIRIQFIVSVVVYLLCVVLLPQIGYGGRVMKIYPSLCAGYFILFIMYSVIIFLYYFNDLNGALFTSFVFCTMTFATSVVATRLSMIWYGLGLVVGSFIGWSVAYYRLGWMEKNFDEHIFCTGNILKQKAGKKPSGKVYDLYSK